LILVGQLYGLKLSEGIRELIFGLYSSAAVRGERAFGTVPIVSPNAPEAEIANLIVVGPIENEVGISWFEHVPVEISTKHWSNSYSSPNISMIL
jgi:hypothetical protein